MVKSSILLIILTFLSSCTTIKKIRKPQLGKKFELKRETELQVYDLDSTDWATRERLRKYSGREKVGLWEEATNPDVKTVFLDEGTRFKLHVIFHKTKPLVSDKTYYVFKILDDSDDVEFIVTRYHPGEEFNPLKAIRRR